MDSVIHSSNYRGQCLSLVYAQAETICILYQKFVTIFFKVLSL